MHARPAQVAEAQALLERRALDHLGPRVEQAPDVARHHAEVRRDRARRAQPDRGSHHRPDVGDAHVQLLDHRGQHRHVRDVAEPLRHDGRHRAAAAAAVDQLHHRHLEPQRQLLAVQRLDRHRPVRVPGPDAEVVGREVDLALLALSTTSSANRAGDRAEPLRIVARHERLHVLGLRVARVFPPRHRTRHGAEFSPRVRVEQRGDAFARPQLARRLLPLVAPRVEVGRLRHVAQCRYVREDVAVVGREGFGVLFAELGCFAEWPFGVGLWFGLGRGDLRCQLV